MKTSIIAAIALAVVCVGGAGAFMLMSDDHPSESGVDLAVYYDGEKVNGTTLDLEATDALLITSHLTVKADGKDVTSSAVISGISDTVTVGESFTVKVSYGTATVKFTVNVEDIPSLTVYYNGSKINDTTLDLTISEASSLSSSLTVSYNGTNVTSSSNISGIPTTISGGESFTVTVSYGTYTAQFSVTVEEPAGLEVYYNGSKINDTTIYLTASVAKTIAGSVTVKMDGTDVTYSATVSGVPSTVSAGDVFTVTVTYGTSSVQFTVSVSSPTSFVVTYVSGTDNCYTVTSEGDEYTVTFSGLTEKSEYAISGTLIGNIVIDAGDYKFVLSLQGVTVESSQNAPVVVTSGDGVTLSAKKGTENVITDNRSAVSDDSDQYSSCVYSVCDLDLQGKGTLNVVSENNNGVHTKDDLNVKNLTLYVECQDNALKGNDSVTIESGIIKLVAKTGDGIKTENSTTTYNDDGSLKKQKGNVVIDSDEGDLVLNIYAACDGIDAAFDVYVSETEGNSVSLSIYTASYSGYSEEVTVDSEMYLIVPDTTSYYSVLFKNGSSAVWKEPEYSSQVSDRSSRTTYYAYTVDVPSGYTQFTVYRYSSSSSQGSTTGYSAVSDLVTVNTSYNACLVTVSGTSLKCSWTVLSTGSSGPGGMPGGNDGNQDTLDYSAKGIKAADSVTISGGTIVIQAYDDAVHANSDTAVEATDSKGSALGYGTGDVTVSDGTLTITTRDDGIHADGTLTVSSGTVTVTTCYEGLEGMYIVVSGGTISVTSSDDGFNSTATSGTGITVSGGYVYVYAGGDGLDANSKTSYAGFKISGGYIVSICTSNDNSALDTENGYTYTGGYVVAFNKSTGGMSGESTKCSNFSSVGYSKSVSATSGRYVTVIDSDSGEKCVVKMPAAAGGIVTLGLSTSPTVSVDSSTSVSLDSNGVYWS